MFKTLVGSEKHTSSTKAWEFWADFLSHGTYWYHPVMFFNQVVLMKEFSDLQTL